MRTSFFRSKLTAGRIASGLLVATSLATAIACSDDPARACRVGADCASGMCNADGTCAPAASASSSGGSSGTPSDAGAETSANLPPDDGGGQVVPGCVPNGDGTIDRSEVPIQAGLHATFRVANDVQVSTAGTATPNGPRTWDLSAALPKDVDVKVETLDLAGTWYGPDFKQATYATALRHDSDLLGIFQTTPDALALRGVASPKSDAFTKTELTYDPPVDFLEFPLTVGKTWTVTSSVTGTAQGVVLLAPYTEKYDAKVDSSGELVTPLGSFHVLRVRIDLTRTVGFAVTTSRSYAFVAECYGNVASIASKDNETSEEFTQAAEVRRIAP